jgi:hypothetical protein
MCEKAPTAHRALPRPEVFRCWVFRESELGAVKKESDAAGTTLPLNPIRGAHVAPQRCTILHDG